MEIKEIWKTIENYPDYQISNLGRIKSLKYGKERILKQGINTNGYCVVVLTNNKKLKTCKVHRIVAQAFIPNPNNLPCVNHKNEQKTDNRIENLEFCTYQYNNSYGTKPERIGKAHSIIKIGNQYGNKPIVQLSLNGEFIKYWKSARQVERELGFSNNNICTCLKGITKTAKGYKWKYLQDYINEQIPYLNELKQYRDRLNDILKKAS